MGEGKRGGLLGSIEDRPQIQGLSVGSAVLSAPLFLWSWEMHIASSQAGCRLQGREGACSHGTIAEMPGPLFSTLWVIPQYFLSFKVGLL